MVCRNRVVWNVNRFQRRFSGMSTTNGPWKSAEFTPKTLRWNSPQPTFRPAFNRIFTSICNEYDLRKFQTRFRPNFDVKMWSKIRSTRFRPNFNIYRFKHFGPDFDRWRRNVVENFSSIKFLKNWRRNLVERVEIFDQILTQIRRRNLVNFWSSCQKMDFEIWLIWFTENNVDQYRHWFWTVLNNERQVLPLTRCQTSYYLAKLNYTPDYFWIWCTYVRYSRCMYLYKIVYRGFLFVP